MITNARLSKPLGEASSLIQSVGGKSFPEERFQPMAVELAGYMLEASLENQTCANKQLGQEHQRMIEDPKGKAFITSFIDRSLRSKYSTRCAEQIIDLIDSYGVPCYLNRFKKFILKVLHYLGPSWGSSLVLLAKWSLKSQVSNATLNSEKENLFAHLKKRKLEGLSLHLSALGEPALGESQAARNLNSYLNSLANPNIEGISVKISTFYSQINLLAWEETLNILAIRLQSLYSAAKSNLYTQNNGEKIYKFVNLDMEGYDYLNLTVELFKKALERQEFFLLPAGIVLQAYLPDSFALQQELTEWAIARVKKGGAPIKITLVKGAYLGREQVEASLKGWPQAPYRTKLAVNANFINLVNYGCSAEHAKAAHIRVATHNLFDIAYALLLRSNRSIEKEVDFAMLEGINEAVYRVVQHLSSALIVHCPVVSRKDAVNATSYLVRYLDEKTDPDNFLCHAFGLKPPLSQWKKQADLFSNAFKSIKMAVTAPRRTQDRTIALQSSHMLSQFENEPDTDISLSHNRQWVESILEEWRDKTLSSISFVLNGKECYNSELLVKGSDPSYPNQLAYRYSLATWEEIDTSLNLSKQNENRWRAVPANERADLLSRLAQKLRNSRKDLIGVLIKDSGKTVQDADKEVSQAIDLAEFYRFNLLEIAQSKDVVWESKGTLLVTSFYNYPLAVPVGAICAALAMGNLVLFRPSDKAVLSGSILVQLLWDAGVPKEALQFLTYCEESVGSKLIKDPRIDKVILTGHTTASQPHLKLHPSLASAAQISGKNTLIITSLSDRELAIKDLVHSAFSHAGQKSGAISLAILEAEVYDDPHFLAQLKDAIESLKVGPAWDPSSKITPLIESPNNTLYKALTTLRPHESWLVKPLCIDPVNHPNLWSPGVKIGVREGSFMHQTGLTGPLLGLMRAEDLDYAIRIANETAHMLTASLHSLDEKEQHRWLEKIESDNLYINCTTTDSIVRRQPFAVLKTGRAGLGLKMGGPNYMVQLATPSQIGLPREKSPINPVVYKLNILIEKIKLSPEETTLWYTTLSNYAYWAKEFKKESDLSLIVGQDNLLCYKPDTGIVLRIYAHDKPLDILRICAAALSCETSIQVSLDKENPFITSDDSWKLIIPLFRFIQETEERFLERVQSGGFKRIRLCNPPHPQLIEASSIAACHLDDYPVLSNGRFELLHYLREIYITKNYHRYGDLGIRKEESRQPIL